MNMKQYLYSQPWLRKTIAYTLIAFGLFALVMPLVPGAILALVGFELIGIRFAFLDRFYPNRPVLQPELVKITKVEDGQ